MKNHNNTIITLFLILFSSSYFSQSFYVAPKMDLFGFVAQSAVRPSIEVAFSRHFSAVISYEKVKYDSGTEQRGFLDPQEVYSLKGWGIMSEIRAYPFTRQRSAPIGFFVGAHFRYRQLSEKYTGQDATIPSIYTSPVYDDFTTKGISYNYGIDIGYKTHINIIVMEFLIGYGNAGGRWKNPNQRDRIDPNYKSKLNDPDNSFRLEMSLGFVLPKVKTGQLLMKDVPSAQTTQADMMDEATVIIYRKRKLSGFLIRYDLYANDSLVTQIANGTYAVYTCKPGVVKFYGKTQEGNSITVNLEKGKTYFLKCNLNMGMFIAQPGFKMMKPAKGWRQSSKIRRRNEKQ